MKSDFNSHFAYFVTDLDLERLEGDALGHTKLVARLHFKSSFQNVRKSPLVYSKNRVVETAVDAQYLRILQFLVEGRCRLWKGRVCTV
ncbi:unnamed protein product [Macrosiphum euphorbiae]|uniref:Uncharacterized protein n=1 Tax=Macrosiphum euphorbiae TaxID=13131 RepID=A0AAV0VEV9_9HEMI|nr:unnamed protein product [Macrosiphum euphorbiae]